MIVGSKPQQHQQSLVALCDNRNLSPLISSGTTACARHYLKLKWPSDSILELIYNVGKEASVVVHHKFISYGLSWLKTQYLQQN